jgi:hypothetical protein
MSMAAISSDESPPPAAHCRLTPTGITDDIKPLDLSVKANEQPLNLCSKRKRNTPVSLSKRNNTSTPNSSTPTTTTTTNSASSMFIPFYAISPLFDPNVTNQQEILQQFQTFYLQLQQKLTKNE